MPAFIFFRFHTIQGEETRVLPMLPVPQTVVVLRVLLLIVLKWNEASVVTLFVSVRLYPTMFTMARSSGPMSRTMPLMPSVPRSCFLCHSD